MLYTRVPTPIGTLTVVAAPAGISRILWDAEAPPEGAVEGRSDLLDAAVTQIREYFTGNRTTFDLPLDLEGTPFQQTVWRELQQIPYGSTTTYGALARRIGAGSSAGAGDARAVGAAVGATPIPIVVPCHRVIGADGSLTGYGGGLHRKRALLDFEAAGGDRSALDAAWRQRQLALL